MAASVLLHVQSVSEAIYFAGLRLSITSRLKIQFEVMFYVLYDI